MIKQNIHNFPKHLSQTVVHVSSSTVKSENSVMTIKNAFS